jgi:hypothetical protein
MKKLTIAAAIATFLFMPKTVNIKLSRDVLVPVTASIAAMNLFSPRPW